MSGGLGSRGEAPVGGLGTSAPEAEAFWQYIANQISTLPRIKAYTFAMSHPQHLALVLYCTIVILNSRVNHKQRQSSSEHVD